MEKYKNNNFKISDPRWNEKLELPDWSYFVFDTQDYFERIIEKQETVTSSPDKNICTQKCKQSYIKN